MGASRSLLSLNWLYIVEIFLANVADQNLFLVEDRLW